MAWYDMAYTTHLPPTYLDTYLPLRLPKAILGIILIPIIITTHHYYTTFMWSILFSS